MTASSSDASARELCAELGVDAKAALSTFARPPIPRHCWQFDGGGGERAGATSMRRWRSFPSNIV